MHAFLALDTQIQPIKEARLPAVSTAAFYGKSVFTTIAVYNSQPFLWEAHWRRLTEQAQRFAIDISEISESETLETIYKLIAVNKITSARFRLTLFDLAADDIWRFESGRKTSLLMTAADFKHVTEPFSLTVSDFPVNSTSPLAGIKSGNYLENILALRAASRAGFNEAVRLNEKGEIVSACLANIFWIKRAEIFMPGLTTGALPGVTRGLIAANYEIREVSEGLERLEEADEIFLTSAGIGIVAAASFQNRLLQNVQIRKLQKWFENLI